MEIVLGIHMDCLCLLQWQPHFGALSGLKGFKRQSNVTDRRSHVLVLGRLAQPFLGGGQLVSWMMQSSVSWYIIGESHQNNTRYIMQLAFGQDAGILSHTELQGMLFRFSKGSTCYKPSNFNGHGRPQRLRSAEQRMLHRMQELAQDMGHRPRRKATGKLINGCRRLTFRLHASDDC
jgi:hypothetical protein